MARRAAKAVPPYGFLALGLAAIIVMTLGGIWSQAAPLSTGEALLWDAASARLTAYLWAEPAAVAVAQAGIAILGDTLFALRIIGPISLVLLAIILIALSPEKARAAAVTAAALILTTPLVLWHALREGSDLAALTALCLALIFATRAAAPPKRKRDPEPWRDWALSGVLGALAVAFSIWAAAPLLGAALAFLAGDQRGRWRGLALGVGLAGVLLTPWGLWLIATGFVPLALGIGPFDPWELIWVIVLGPVLLGLRRIGAAGLGGAALGGAAGLMIAAAAGLPGQGAALMLSGPLALSFAADLTARKGGVPRWPFLIGPGLAVIVLAAAAVQARYGHGLPALADPFARDRFTAAQCESVLVVMDDVGAEALVSAHLDDQMTCRWLGALTDAPVVLTDLPVGFAPGMRVRLGPLALEEGRAGLLISYPPARPEAQATSILRVVSTERVIVPLHLDRERQVDLSLVAPAR